MVLCTRSIRTTPLIAEFRWLSLDPRIGWRQPLRPQRLNRQLMGIRSKVAMLPAAMRAEVDRLIVDRAFSGYQALADGLQAMGYRISDDSLQRSGVRLRHQLDVLNLVRCQAQALAAAGKNSGGTVDPRPPSWHGRFSSKCSQFW